MGNYEFEETYDWRYLADYFDITVPYNDVIEVKQSLYEQDMFIYTDKHDEWIEEMNEMIDPIDKAGYYCYHSESDIVDDIRLSKLKTLIGKAKFDLSKDHDHCPEIDGEEVYSVCREFVKKFVKDADYTYTEFWEKMLEIESDYVFLDALQRNIRDLWW